MLKDNREDISNKGEVDYTFISLEPSKLRVLIIGAGKGGYIKAKGFLEKKSYVEVLSKEFLDDFYTLKDKGLNLIKGEYDKSYIVDKHLIIIAIDDLKTKKQIVNDCKEMFKIFIDSSNFKEGMAIIPVEKRLKYINLAINSKVGNPKGTLMVADELKRELTYYDDFLGFSAKVRNRAKNIKEYKKDIIEFITSKDYFYMWKKDKGEKIIKMFYDEEIANYLLGGIEKDEFNNSHKKK